jgi:hypothetical protein
MRDQSWEGARAKEGKKKMSLRPVLRERATLTPFAGEGNGAWVTGNRVPRLEPRGRGKRSASGEAQRATFKRQEAPGRTPANLKQGGRAVREAGSLFKHLGVPLRIPSHCIRRPSLEGGSRPKHSSQHTTHGRLARSPGRRQSHGSGGSGQHMSQGHGTWGRVWPVESGSDTHSHNTPFTHIQTHSRMR